MRALALLLLVLTGSGCAFGYAAGIQTGGVSTAASPSKILISDQASTLSSPYQEFRCIDTTGILLAALVNTARTADARDRAIEDAAGKAPDANGVRHGEATWTPMPIMSGLVTDLRFRLGLPGAKSSLFPSREMSYWGFDLRPEFISFLPIQKVPLLVSLFLSLKVDSWETKKQGLDEDLKIVEMDMMFGSSASYVILPDLVATTRLSVGFLSPILGLISGGGLLNGSAELEVGWRPFHTDFWGVMISGVGYVGHEFAIDRSGWVARGSLNLTLTLGMQTKARPQSAAPPGAQPSI